MLTKTATLKTRILESIQAAAKYRYDVNAMNGDVLRLRKDPEQNTTDLFTPQALPGLEVPSSQIQPAMSGSTYATHTHSAKQTRAHTHTHTVKINVTSSLSHTHTVTHNVIKLRTETHS